MRHTVLTTMPGGELARRWNEFLADARFATHYVTPNYFIDPYATGRRFAVIAEDDGGIAAVMTGVVDGLKAVAGMFSRPQLVFRKGADRVASLSSLNAGVEELVGSKSLVEIYSWEPFDELALSGGDVTESGDETSVVMLDLSLGVDAIFAGFSQTRRNEIRKALRQQTVEVKELETENELAAIYEIHCQWNTRKGHTPGTIEQMRTAVEQRDNRRIFIAKTNGKVVAGSFYRFCTGGVVEYAANFSLPEYQKLRPNDLIGWHAIQWACEAGFAHFSMGGSHLFLRRFGGEIKQTFCYRGDNRSFGIETVSEHARHFGAAAYQRLPRNVRSGVRRMLAR